MIAIGAAVVVVAAVAAVLASRGGSSSRPPTVNIPGVVHYQVASRNHTTAPVSYPQNPPVGGDHYPVWQNCGAYDAPVRTEQAVHSMEHGAVWITYRPDLPAPQITALQAYARQSYVLVSPYPGLPDAVVASAWGYQLRLGGADDPRLGQFVRALRAGPQAPESGAACAGGLGRPVMAAG